MAVCCNLYYVLFTRSKVNILKYTQDKLSTKTCNMENYIVPGLTEAVARAIVDHNWRPVKRLLERTLPEDSVEYRQLQQIHVNDNLIKEACTGGFTELVSVFLNSGVQVDFIVDKWTGRTLSGKETMLHLAARRGHLSLVKLLINVGADIECKTHNGKTPLYYAVKYSHLDVVKYLINAGANVKTCDEDGEILLETSLRCNVIQEEMLQLLLESGCDPSKRHSCYPLNLAVRTNNVKYVKMLLEAGAHVNSTDTDTDIPLHSAAWHSNIPVMQLLLVYGADINARRGNGDTALHRAVKDGNLQSVKFLIEHGSLINSVDDSQKTPLLLSISYKKFDKAMMLINSGTDLDFDIHHAVLHDVIIEDAPIYVIECLLEHGANVTTLDCNKTALQRVIFYSDYSNDEKLHIVKLLLIYGSDHYVEDRYGNTLLHWACEMGDVELVEYLIDYGLNVDANNREKKKPIDIAHETGHPAIVNIIIEYHCNKYSI